jgi:hypothetical protein
MLPYPFDSIGINRFYMYFDYSTLGFNLIGTTYSGTDVWEFRDIFYENFNNTYYSFGNLQFTYIIPNLGARTMTFNIEDDALESIQLKTSGSWFYGDLGEKQVMTLYLTRVGP